MQGLNVVAVGRVRRRRAVQWVLAPVVVIVMALGWRYPAIGFAVPVVMGLGLLGSLFRGRYVCGHLCPRGAVFDRWLGWAGPTRRIPGWMRGMGLRWGVFAVLMAAMALNLSRDPSSWRHWGFVFWLMCTATTGVALVLAAVVHPRSWCSVCPMGTMQNAIGGGRHELLIDREKCRVCARCEKACPLRLPITKHLGGGVVRERDCLKCGECVAACPFGALRWKGEGEGEGEGSTAQV